ncbi:DUF4244 domain-containing protein [Streptomyces sp. NPDC093018]|uniref:DUF4244 domain-containing protein n=1 Tax=Streptomyces sp. NPDC093018 TaxID=3155067 RepID=UPI00342D090C
MPKTEKKNGKAGGKRMEDMRTKPEVMGVEMKKKIVEALAGVRRACRRDSGMVTSEYAMGIIVILGF